MAGAQVIFFPLFIFFSKQKRNGSHLGDFREKAGGSHLWELPATAEEGSTPFSPLNFPQTTEHPEV